MIKTHKNLRLLTLWIKKIKNIYIILEKCCFIVEKFFAIFFI